MDPGCGILQILLINIREDDYELLKFAFEWIKFGLFGKKVFWVKDEQPA